MAQLGRISGPLLKENLLRNGKDLAFRNTQETTQLLYIDVNTNRIGVNTGTPTNELQNVGTLKTIDLITGPSTVAGFNISDGKIEAIGNIELNAAEAVIFPALENGTLRFNDNTISSILSSSDIDITPNGTGKTNIESNLNVIGDLTATGSITLDGTINFGDAADDSTYPVDTVTFETEIDSDIIPDQSDTYNLGANQKRWNEIYTNLVNGQAVNATQLTVGTIDFTLRQGNIFYVAQNGSDTNKGDHPQSPVASIRRALELADASIGGPVAIFVNAGDYEEETPLVVPSNVSIIGIEMRNVNVFPTSYTQSEDVFHLNGETTIQNITVKDFYFDDNKGYAFRFAPDAVISTRSPYVQNCTVITKGSNITVNDPRGFNSGDAGRGAYVDGAELNSASVDASMLFHSVTFITPGVDGLTMTNGVRVEWLNSFTYFANRGLYAFNNSTGRVLQDGSTIGYGAELRSIGSANVYGNYGAVADGADTLMYLIQHNFGYIGSGINSENDLGLVVQANEVVEENSGTIYYSTTDQSGNYRVGDNFIVDFDTGGTSINLSALAADSLNGIIVTTGIDTTVFKGDRVETGNLRFTGNTVETLSGNLTIDSPLEINLQDNTNISNNLDIIGDLSFDGNLNLLGNQTTDTLVFNVDFDQDFSPNQTLAFNLGSPSKEWLTAHLSRLESGDISFYDNVIETNTSNANLELKPSGTGNVYIPQNATISNALIVNQTSNLQDVTITGDLLFTGDLNLVGSGESTENVDVLENLTVGASVEFEEILIDTNVVTTTTTNANLELRANGTGTIKILNNDLRVTNNLDILGDTFTSDIISSQQVSAVKFTNTTYEITLNKIDTVISNANLELRANGTGDVIIPNNNVQISNNLTVDGVTNLDVTAINGTLTQVGDTTQTGNYDIAGEFTVDNVYVEDNFITTTSGNLTLSASGTGNINVDTNDVEIAQDLTASGATDLQTLTITGALTHVGDTVQTGNLDIAGEISNGNIVIEDNVITSTNTNSDLELRANGTGEVVIDSDDSLTINNNLFVGGILEYQGTLTIDGNVTLQGNIQDGSLTVTEDFDITGTLDIGSQAQFEDIRIQDNFVTTTQSNSNLELRAAGTGEVLIPNNNLQVNNNLFTASISTGDINVNNDLVLDELVITDSNIEINENYITTKISNADLELRANGNGIVSLQENAILSQDLTVNTNTNLQNVNINGTLTHTGDRTQTGDYTLTGNLNLDSLVTDRELQFDDVRVSGNVLETTLSNSNLDLRASGTGEVLFNENVQMGQDLTVGDLNVGSISVDTDVAFEEIELSTDIQFEDNYITTTNSNSNLELRAAGAGKVFLQDLDLGQNIIGVVGSGVDSSVLDITLSPSEDLIVNSTSVLQIPKGDTSQRVIAQDEFLDGGVALNSGTILDGGDADTIFGAGDTIYNSGGSILSTSGNLGDIRFNTDENVFEGTSTSTITFNGIYSTDRQTSVTADPTSNNIRFLINGVASPLDSSNLVGEVTGEGLIIHGLQVDDVLLDNNVISTNVSNSDLDLATNGTGELVLDDLSFKSNLIKNNANNLIVKHTGLGYPKASGTFGIVVPSGATITPTPNPEVGDTRWNTSAQQLETWDGTEYISSAGVASAITPEEFDDLLLEYTIIFG